MGKSWKTRSHLNTGYPYNPIRAAHLQVIRPRVRDADEEQLFLGMYAEGHPIFSKAEFKAVGRDLKRLEFLRVYGQHYASKLAKLYKTSRQHLPGPCLSGLNTIETRVTTLSAPLVNGLQSGGERILWTLDSKVDAVLRAADYAIHPAVDAKALTPSGVRESQQAYLARLEEAVQFVREHGVAGSAKHAVAALLQRLDETRPAASAAPDTLPLLGDAWEKLAAYPPVNRLLEQAQPSLEYTQRRYTDAHDAIVASSAYNRAVGTAAEVLQRVAENSIFKAAVERLYPAISGIADPAYERLAASTYLHALVEHLKPVAPEGESCAVVSCMPC